MTHTHTHTHTTIEFLLCALLPFPPFLTIDSTRYTMFFLFFFPLKMLHPEIHQIEKLKLLGISRYKFKMGYNLNLYRGVSRFGGFRGCSIFSGICQTQITSYELRSIFTTRSLALRMPVPRHINESRTHIAHNTSHKL